MKSGTKVGVLGSGVVGQTISSALARLGHSVTMGTRDPAATLARTEPGRFGTPSFKDWKAQNPAVQVAAYAQAAAASEVIVAATNGRATLAALEEAGGKNLAGKVLVDITNPLDDSRGFPPSLLVCNTDSLGEQVQRAHPGARVVKTLNIVNAWLMVAPQQLAGGDHTMLLCGNDAGAKATVKGMLESLGWKDLIDLGDITNARGLEMYLPLWVRLYGAVQKPMFSIKVVR